MIEIATGTDLPRPGPDRLVLYLLGPGFGESQVIAFPDGRWMVVDGCTRAGLNLPLKLLEHLSCREVDLLVVTHPDLDHIRGLPALIDRFPPKLVWTYPAAMSLRNWIIRWTQHAPPGRRAKLEALRELHSRIQHLLEDKNIVRQVRASMSSWPPDERAYCVHCIAPTPNDEGILQELLDSAVSFDGDRFHLSTSFQDRLCGDKRPGDAPNLLSLALSVRWQGFRFLLAGDVENGNHKFSGWPGVLDVLQQDGRLDLVRQLDLVKVAHHGSRGACHAPTWEHHVEGRKEGPIAVLTPFNRGKVQLPDPDGLSALRARASILGITAAAGRSLERADGAGFSRVTGAAPPRRKVTGPVIAAVFGPGDRITVHAGDMAALFKPRPQASLADHLEAMDSLMP